MDDITQAATQSVGISITVDVTYDRQSDTVLLSVGDRVIGKIHITELSTELIQEEG